MLTTLVSVSVHSLNAQRTDVKQHSAGAANDVKQHSAGAANDVKQHSAGAANG